MTRRSKREVARWLDDVEPESNGVDRSQFELTDGERLLLDVVFGEKDPLDHHSEKEWERIENDFEEWQERWQGETLATMERTA